MNNIKALKDCIERERIDMITNLNFNYYIGGKND